MKKFQFVIDSVNTILEEYKLSKIKIGIIGVGNCASSLVQGLTYYHDCEEKPIGLMHKVLGGYEIKDIEVGLAYDVDVRKVGKDVAEAIFAKPNCTKVFAPNVPKTGVIVKKGVVLDGISEHTQDFDEDISFRVSPAPEPTKAEIVQSIKDSGVDMIISYLPVGSREAAYFYADCALEAKVGYINCMPVFIASDDRWIARFKEAGVPCIGDDIKSQLGATIVHRELMRLFEERGIKIMHTYQLNTGGNTDFLNMLNRSRLADKKVSKTQAVQSNLKEPLDPFDIHVGPSDFVPWQHDNKLCFLRIEGQQFGDVPMNLELRLSVEDSPNSAGVVIDAIRCMKIALDRGLSGDIVPPSSYFMKHPRVQREDFLNRQLLEDFINNK
jgi:myo-inositol-1-phosphate synthase